MIVTKNSFVIEAIRSRARNQLIKFLSIPIYILINMKQ
jgi:hypothetical protein